MNKKIQIGDSIDINYDIDGENFSDQATITFIDKDKIYTCGHCFPQNATTSYGDIIYTSGFDIPTEKEERAIIQIKPELVHKFRQMRVNNKFDFTDNQPVVMINDRENYNGKIIAKVDDKLRTGWVRVGDILIDHQITKLEPPYFLVKINKIKNKLGLSGSPWIANQDNQLQLVGGHIGKTNARSVDNKMFKVAYVKPIKML